MKPMLLLSSVLPALYLTRSTNSDEHEPDWGKGRLEAYINNHYHEPSDEYHADWDLRGASQEVQLLHHMGSELASNRDFPKWNEGVEFKATCDATMNQSID